MRPLQCPRCFVPRVFLAMSGALNFGDSGSETDSWRPAEPLWWASLPCGKRLWGGSFKGLDPCTQVLGLSFGMEAPGPCYPSKAVAFVSACHTKWA